MEPKSGGTIKRHAAKSTVHCNRPSQTQSVDRSIDTVRFTDESQSIGSSIISWHWDFGDGDTSLLQNPVHYYSVPGTYTVVLSVENLNNCIESITHTLTVSDAPVADFTYNSLGCDTVFFTDASVSVGNTIVSWAWDFGDPASGTANVSNLQNPYHIYNNAGTYTVSLIVTDGSGCNSAISDDIVITRPVAEFAIDQLLHQ